MANKPTDKSKYPSRYSPSNYVTAAQYIIELICEKKAHFDKTELPVKFWNLPTWRAFFVKNLRQVHKLLKKYNERAIIAALKHKSFQNCYSIFTDRFIRLVQEEQIKIDAPHEKKTIEDTINRNTVDSKPRQSQKTDNLIDKLKNL